MWPSDWLVAPAAVVARLKRAQGVPAAQAARIVVQSSHLLLKPDDFSPSLRSGSSD
jgi:hypothetical protein